MFISDEDARFLKKQKRVALRHCGVVDPTSIDDYIKKDGYKAIDKALHMTPKRSSRRSRSPVWLGAAALASPPGSSGTPPATPRGNTSTSSATPTRATPVHLWTVPSSSPTPTA